MNTSHSSDTPAHQPGRPPTEGPSSRRRTRLVRIACLATGAGVLAAVMVVAVLVLVLAQSVQNTMTSVAGTWVGTGAVSAGGPSTPFAVYLQLTTNAHNQIAGTGAICAVTATETLTITGAPGSSRGPYLLTMMVWTTTDPTGITHVLHITARVSPIQMIISGVDLSTSPPTYSGASLRHGSMHDYTAKCNSLPTPTSSA